MIVCVCLGWGGGQKEGTYSILVFCLKNGAFGVERGKGDFAPRPGTAPLPIFMFHGLDFALYTKAMAIRHLHLLSWVGLLITAELTLILSIYKILEISMREPGEKLKKKKIKIEPGENYILKCNPRGAHRPRAPRRLKPPLYHA